MKINTKHFSIVLATLLSFSGCGGGEGGSLPSSNNFNSNLQAQYEGFPAVTINGDKKVYLTIGETYQDEGVSAIDTEDGDLTQSIKTTSNVNFSQPGRYKITYEVTDRDGHTTTVDRKVYIQDFISSVAPREGLSINEILTANVNTKIDPDFKQFSDWIELYNNSDNNISLDGYYLSDDENNPTKWKFPARNIESKNYMLIWTDKENSGLHTNFSLSSSGGKVILSDYSGQKIDEIDYKKQKSDISCTRIGNKIYYMNPTPLSVNQSAYGEKWKTKKPIFSKNGGFYKGRQNITLTQESGGVIYYTTDGSIPTINSNQYTKPIQIDKTTIIRARSLKQNQFMSSPVSQTYLINENVTLPVFSIGVDEKYLYDDKIGIHVVGTDSNGKAYKEDDRQPNYNQNWVRPASIEFFRDEKSQFSENIGLRINGDHSRSKPQKSLAIYAKDKFGSKKIKYPLFRYKPYIREVKSFILRNAGNDWTKAFMTDGVIHTLVKDMMDIDYESYEPAIVFINGQYWGLLNIREKSNKDYLSSNHGADPDNVDILKTRGADIDNALMSGSTDNYKDLVDYVKSHDLSNDEFYNVVKNRVDLVEYMNYMITEVFIGNSDWLGKNVRFWRKKDNSSKWRWFLHDTDFGLGLYVDLYGTDTDTLARITKGDWRAVIFANLLKNPEFKSDFAGRFLTHLNTTFMPTRVEDTILKAKAVIEPEIDRHYAFWKPQFSKPLNRPRWESSIERMINYAYERNPYVRGHIKSHFNLNENLDLTIPKVDNGKVLIDDVPLRESFNAPYFSNVSVTLKAVPNEGYKFVQWSDGSKRNNRKILLTSNLTISPFFESAQTPKIVINEFNYNSDKNFKTGDWIELYNNDIADIDLSSWEIKDAKVFGSFKIPNNTMLKAGEYIVLAGNLELFKKHYPNVKAVGNFEFGLGSEDSIRVFDKDGLLIDSISYDKSWPDAKGNGKTVILTNPDSDNSLAENWTTSDIHGSAGFSN